MVDPVAYACRVARHAGWYAHYGTHIYLMVDKVRRSSYGARGMRLREFFEPWAKVYEIDGSTCRRPRKVWLVNVHDKWYLIIEVRKILDGLSIEWVKQEYEITENEALKILACYWKGALLWKMIYPHYRALKVYMNGEA